MDLANLRGYYRLYFHISLPQKMEPTSLVILGTAIGTSAKLVEKILGPTAEYIGAGIKTWAEKRRNNAGRVFGHAQRKLGSRIESEGAVPPRVLKAILDEGSFADDELTAEYFGGVLASSRTEVSRDDRGAVFAALVGRLSAYQIRAHYVFYRLVKELFDGDPLNVGLDLDRNRLRVFVPAEVFAKAMDFSPREQERVSQITSHVLLGLAKEELIDQPYAMGPEDQMRHAYGPRVGNGIVFQPYGLGVELFLWAHGRGDLSIGGFLERENTFVSETDIEISPGSVALDKVARVSEPAAPLTEIEAAVKRELDIREIAKTNPEQAKRIRAFKPTF